jgi:N-ethylmaleimide reductase
MKEMLLTSLVTPTFTLSNRVVMAPMNRRRAINGIPSPSAPIYYGQRASAGLIITDNTAVTPNGIGYLHTPGIYNEAQKKIWKQVTDEVHARNGKIFIQLVHAGRIGHPLNHEGGTPLVAPSAVKASGILRTPGDIYLPMPEPKALTAAGVQTIIDAHILAAINAMEAGFDGVEIHGAHGFLADQFLNPQTNLRTDCYGGSVVNRSRFLLEILEGVSAAIGKGCTGVRLSPFATIHDLTPYADEREVHQFLADAIGKMDILYIHLSNEVMDGRMRIPEEFVRDLRQRFPNLLIQAGGFTADTAQTALESRLVDLIAFGRPFIANPDLVERFQNNIPLVVADEATFYTGGDAGYIDYPPFS